MDQIPSQQQPRLVLDVDELNLYCPIWEETLSDKSSFEKHLEVMHSICQSASKQSNKKPDINDYNSYCRTVHVKRRFLANAIIKSTFAKYIK